MAREVTRTYTNGEITVVWKPHLCIHSTKCFTGLPAVFNPRARPWVDIQGASSGAIAEQVGKCPSGALSVLRNEPGTERSPAPAAIVIEVAEDGPLVVHGRVTVRGADGAGVATPTDRTAFCRCGGSGNKPFCDGTHTRNGFRG